MARSRALLGPYELHPDVHILSARHRPDVALQRAGHADLVETQSGETYMVYLCGRPLGNRGRCTLGRETAIQPMTWGAGRLAAHDDGRRHSDGGGAGATGSDGAAAPTNASFARSSMRTRCRSRSNGCDRHGPTSCSASASGRATCVFTVARRSAASSRQALVARRQQSHCYSASTIVEFEPEHFQQMAGLVCYYNSSKFHYFYVSRDEESGKHLFA